MEAVDFNERLQQNDFKSLRKSTSGNVLCGFSLEEVTNKAVKNDSVELDENNNPVNKQSEPHKVKRVRKRRELVDKENIVGDLNTMCTRRSSKRLKKQETFDTSEINQVSRVKNKRIDSKLKNKSLNILDKTPATKPIQSNHKSPTIEYKTISSEDLGFLEKSEVSPILRDLVTYQVDECEQIEMNSETCADVDDNQLLLQTGVCLDLDKSVDIPLVVYDFNNNQVLKQNLTNQLNTVEQKNPENLSPFHVGLNLSCHSDTSYNFEELDPFGALTEELDANNNLVMRHEKLKSFIVTSNLNKKTDCPQKNNLMKRENFLEVLDEINMLSKENVMNFNGIEPVELDQENFNFKFFRGVFNNSDIENDLGLSVCRAGNIDFENFTSPLLAIEDQAQKLEQQEKAALNKQNQSTEQEVFEKKEPELNEDLINESFKKEIFNKWSRLQSKEKETDYAIKKAFEIFSNDELATGIFCDLNKKGEQIIRSKNRVPLDEAKTYELKDKIRKKFKMNHANFEKAWKFIKLDLNKLLGRVKRVQRS